LDTIIKWPQEQNIRNTCETFSMKQGIRNILGAIDGTHIE